MRLPVPPPRRTLILAEFPGDELSQLRTQAGSRVFRGSRWKIVRRFWWRPVLPFVVEFVVLAPLVLADEPANAVGGIVFFLPWLLALMALINLPFVASAFRAFHLDRPTRRNHALEHATIHVLEAAGARRLGGRASSTGFRIAGRVSPHEIRKAFEQVRQMVRRRDRLPHISRRCGSNVVSALGLALLLLFVVTLVSLLLHPPFVVRASALAFVVAFFVSMRHALGNWIQARFFMATDFDEVGLRDVNEVAARPMERPPVHFVATIVRPRPPARPS